MQRGFAHIIVLILLLVGVGIGLYLISNSQVFKPKAFNNKSGEVNVLVLKYFPTDGSGRLDRNETNLDYSLEEVRNKVNTLNQAGVVSLTNGTKYHGYKNATAAAALHYTIVDQKEYLEPLPRGLSLGREGNRPDYRKMLERVNICDYVDNKKVSQIWVWGYHTGQIVPVESNMSMGNRSREFWNHGDYGDVSNSEQTNDLPICNNTYVLYNYNYERGLGEFLEDHGHQIEALFRFVDNPIWDKFQRPHGLTKGEINRCGWTHSPPNVTDAHQYLWNSEETVLSDCEDWKLEGYGQVKEVNCHTWYGAECKDNGGVEFKTWWMQNIPGMNNNISYQGRVLKNWWDYYGDFDQALLQGRSLISDRGPVDDPIVTPTPEASSTAEPSIKPDPEDPRPQSEEIPFGAFGYKHGTYSIFRVFKDTLHLDGWVVTYKATVKRLEFSVYSSTNPTKVVFTKTYSILRSQPGFTLIERTEEGVCGGESLGKWSDFYNCPKAGFDVSLNISSLPPGNYVVRLKAFTDKKSAYIPFGKVDTSQSGNTPDFNLPFAKD